ncbi:MAG: hypothetical protein E7399_05720 [Ruminococcaceae bacterium]|nr:hypothetical protein [Oscillospiraceae bacterium]
MARRANTSSAYRLYDNEPSGIVRQAEKRRDRNQLVEHRKETSMVKQHEGLKKISGRLIGNLLLICVFAFLILFRYSAIVERDHELSVLKQERDAITDENKRLQVEIDSALNLDNVERVAMNELGMGKPEKYQTIYVNIQGDDYVEVAEEVEESTAEGKQFYATIIQTLGNVLEYLY